MTETRLVRQRWGWESRGDVSQRNPLGDWSVRIGLAGIGVLIVGMMLAPTLGDDTSEKVGILRVASIAGGVCALAGFVLALSGIRRATEARKSMRSAVWGIVLTVLLAASISCAYLLSVWIRS